ncbi:MAG: molybdopterin cofactor-binding domain-containing protein [Pseudomonadota bacterium]
MGKILRRTFLIGGAAIAGGVAFGAYYVNRDHPNPLAGKTAEGEVAFNPYLRITDDNRITIMIPRAEMGQGVTTTLAALLAEELDVELESVKAEIAPAANAYYNAAMLEEGAGKPHFDRSFSAEALRATMGTVGKVLGLQVTGGSSSTLDAYEKMRMAGATARETLKLAAYKKTGIDTDRMKTRDGHVILPDGTKLTYGSLANTAAEIDTPSNVSLRPASDWKMLGKSQPRTDMRAKSTGAPIFGMDVDLPDMVYATLKMNPRLGGPMTRMDADEARKIKGVIDVVDMTATQDEAFGGGFAVIATNTWAAFKGAEAVDVDWGPAPYPATTQGIMDVIAKTLDRSEAEGDGDVMRDEGDVKLAFADAPRGRIVEARYQVPYLAHATMEPMNATAQLKDGELHIWAGTQAPTLVRDDCAYEAGVDKEKTFIHSTYLGGGFGRRGEIDFCRYAARLAKKTDGKPVKLVWSREEDMTHDTYRPAAISTWKARLDEEGFPVAVDGRIACPSIIKSVMGRTFPSIGAAGPDNTITQGAADQPYDIADYKITGVKAPVDIPIGFWRSVGNSYNGFFHECFMDEIAHATGKDPIEMRRRIMAKHPTALGTLNKVAELADWSAPAIEGRGKGVAFTLSFGCWTAIAVEVAQTDDGIRIEKVSIAADIGQALDSAIVATQLQSGAIYGLSSCLGEKITFEDGMVQETNYDTYEALRMHQCPQFAIEVMETAEHMGGSGEPGTPPVIPALANAVFNLTGKRVRSMPLSDEVEFV